MNNYTKFQKIMSFTLILTIFFNFTVNLSFFGFLNTIFASDNERYDLVAIIVQEDIYKGGTLTDGIQSSVDQYAKNIQSVLPNTKTMIIPTPSDTHPFNIASILEKLYFEGYKGLSGMHEGEDLNLVGSVFIGDIPLPVVHKGSQSEKTILPYIDFENKLYIFNHESNFYEYNENNNGSPTSEIWHGFISPNTGDRSTDIQKINDYFAKNNEYYKGEGKFENSHKPSVFYYDQIREEKAVRYVDYKGYNSRIDNIEDIFYNRFTKQLAGNLENTRNEALGQDLVGLESLLPEGVSTTNSIVDDTIPDIHTKSIIEASSKRYLEIFNPDTSLGEFRKDVYNAGRYTDMPNVSVDMVPQLLEYMDEVSFNHLKTVNTDLENYIDDIVMNGLSRKIPILNEINRDNFGKYYDITLKNYYSGLAGESIESADQCSIFRGFPKNDGNRSQIVEANKAFNVSNDAQIEEDIEILTNNINIDRPVINRTDNINYNQVITCFDENTNPIAERIFGNNTVLNLKRQGEESDYDIDLVDAGLSSNLEDPISDAEKIEMFQETIQEEKQDIQSFETLKEIIENRIENIKRLKQSINQISYLDVSLDNDLEPTVSNSPNATDNENKCTNLIYNGNICTSTYNRIKTPASDGNPAVIRTKREQYNAIKSDLENLIQNQKKLLRNDTNFTGIISNGNSLICDQYPDGNYSTQEKYICDNKNTHTNNLSRIEKLLLDFNDIILKSREELEQTEKMYQAFLDEEEETPILNDSKYLDEEEDPYTLSQQNRYNRFVYPIFDIAGSKALPYNDNGEQYIPNDIIPTDIFAEGETYSPMDCLVNDIMIDNYTYDKSTPRKKTSDRRGNKNMNANLWCDYPAYELVSESTRDRKRRRSSSRRHRVKFNFKCEYIYDSCLAPIDNSALPGNPFGNFNGTFFDIYDNSNSLDINYSGWTLNYNSIPSYIMHKSPTFEELRKQQQTMITPSLPVDSDRYVDFVSAIGEYVKYIYPNLFRLKDIQLNDLDYDLVDEEIKKYLDNKSIEFNNILSSNNPGNLSGEELELYNLFKDGNYPNFEVDFYNLLKDKSTLNITVGSHNKQVNYYDQLVLAVYWHNLNNVPSKYKFIFEHFLSDQFSTQDVGYDFFLPRNKQEYEMAYIGAPGDSQNMYIGLDPEEKGENPYAGVFATNAGLDNFMSAPQDGSIDRGSGEFNCSPPEGVPLWEWFDAVKCWLDDLEIGIYPGRCSGDQLLDFDNQCSDEENIPSCELENIENGDLIIDTKSSKFGLNENGKLTIFIENSVGNPLMLYEKYDINIFISKVKNGDQTIFDINNDNINSQEQRNKVNEYIDFNDGIIGFVNGKSEIGFLTKNSEVEVTFEAILNIDDIEKTSTKTINITESGITTTLYNLGNQNLSPGDNNIFASDDNNLFIASEEDFNNSKNNIELLKNQSDSINKIFISLTNKDANQNTLDLNFPIFIDILKEGLPIRETQTLNSLENITTIGGITKEGRYDIKITDDTGDTLINTINVLPNHLSELNINLGTHILETGGVYTTNFIDLKDRFGNLSGFSPFYINESGEPVGGMPYNVIAEINGNGITFEDGTTKKEFSSPDGLIPFRLKSTNRNGASQINFRVDNTNISKNIDIITTDNIQFDINIINSNVEVGNNEYEYEIRVKTNLISGVHEGIPFNSRAYLRNNDIYYTSNESFVKIENSFGKGSFNTKTKSGDGINFELAVEGIKETIKLEDGLNIKSGDPLKVDYFLSKSNLQANNQDSTKLLVMLKDYYGNVVKKNTKVTIEVPDRFSDILHIENNSIDLVDGQGSTTIRSTNIPGRAFFKLESELDLNSNFVTLPGQSPFIKHRLNNHEWLRDNGNLTDIGKAFLYDFDNLNYQFIQKTKNEIRNNSAFSELTDEQKDSILELFDNNDGIKVYGESQNAGKIKSSYFLNNIDSYNALYTTLMGGAYGDITSPGYIAGNLLFDRNNRSLAVTSLLNDTSNGNNILRLNSNGSASKGGYFSHLTQDIIIDTDISNKGLKVTLYNDMFGNFISDIYLNFVDEGFSLNACIESNVDNCLDEKVISLSLLDNNYNLSHHERSNLTITDNNNNQIISIGNNGEINFLHPSISYDIDSTAKNGFVFTLSLGNEEIAQLGIGFKDEGNVSYGYLAGDIEMESIDEKGIFINILSSNYGLNENYLGTSNKESVGYTITYRDPFALSNNLSNNVFLEDFNNGYEFFPERGGIGWSGQNKTKLAVSAGKTVGQATKDYMSFSLINLGDPVFSLKERQKNLPGTDEKRKFDSGIGYKISSDSNNIAFQVLDYNDNGIDDIVILKKDGYIELLEGTNDLRRFINKGNLVYFSDFGGNKTLQTGDFTGNGYDDILILNKKRKPILIHNEEKKFSRIDLDLELDGEIAQIIAFKMDVSSSREGGYDIVTLDDNGDIKIHFGTDTPGKFDSKMIGSGLGVTLNNDIRKDLGSVYFDGLYQLPTQEEQRNQDISGSEDLLATMEENMEALQNGEISLDDMDDGSDFNEGIFERLIFDKFIYGHEREVILGDDGFPIIPENPKPTTFIKSEYALAEGLKLTQKFENISLSHNDSVLRSNDEVTLEIRLENNTNRVLNNIAYVGEIPSVFSINKDKKIELIKGLNTFEVDSKYIKDSPDNRFDFLIDEYFFEFKDKNIVLNPGEEIKFKIHLKTLPFTFGYIQAGYFKDGSEGGNNNGDIIFKPNAENCGGNYDIYYSYGPTTLRQYRKIKEELSCDSDTPDELDIQEQLDLIDVFSGGDIDPNNPKVIESMESMGEMLNQFKNDFIVGPVESVWDSIKENGMGIFDTQDNISRIEEDFSDSFTDIDNMALGALGFEDMDEALGAIDDLVDGFGCGFGGGSCINSPLNWAPLAPGSSPTLFGMPIAPSLMTPSSGLPVFSAFTNFLPTPAGPVPFIWPPIPGMAGGWLGPANGPIRIYVTPTLTGAVGTAICFGPSSSGFIPPPGASPITPGGNCIVAAKPFLGCGDGGGDIDDRLISNIQSENGFAVINSNCDINNKENDPYLSEFPAKLFIDYKIVNEILNSGVGIDEDDIISLIENGITEDEYDIVEGQENLGILSLSYRFNKDYRKALLDSLWPNNDNSGVDIDGVNEFRNDIEEIDFSNPFSFINVSKNILKSTINNVAGPGGTWNAPNTPLISVSGSGDPVDLSVDVGALASGNFKDIVDLQMNRISSFPDFIMGWVTSQIEEIVTKLTDWPTIFVVLPDFTGVLDFDIISTLEEADKVVGEKRAENESELERLENEMNNLEQQKRQLCDNPSNSDERIACAQINNQITSKGFEIAEFGFNSISLNNSSMDGIKKVFEFVSRMPIVSFNLEKVYFDIPFLDPGSIFKAQIEMERAYKQWTEELDRASKSWSYGAMCDENDPNYESCMNEHGFGSIIDAQNLISSLEKNIEILEKWKKLPEDINELIKIRETRLEQVICNIESLLEIWVVWIGENGKIFKSWVDLYITVKAVLKSWQLLIDLFFDFEAECKSCKNERHDLMNFIWKLISFIIPSIPIIEFPKWPDLWIDLHNINVGIQIGLPEIEMNIKPIDIPVKLPNLYLPDAPTVSLTLPPLPLLPEPNVPELPELPTFPEIVLPNLPPPPKLPQIFTELQGVLEILKLVVKIMCILKTSPFVPEWRAGDLIAFITERGGTLPTDFLDVDISGIANFSYPFIDAVRVTTFVEFTMGNNQILEMIQKASNSWNQKTYEAETQIKEDFNFSIDDIDLRKYAIPDLDLGGDWPNTEKDESRIDSWLDMVKDQYNNWENDTKDVIDDIKDSNYFLDEAKDVGDNIIDEVRDVRDGTKNILDLLEGNNNEKSGLNLLDLAKSIAFGIGNFHKNMEDNSREISIDDFQLRMNSEISKEFLHSDSRYEKLLYTYSEPLRYDYREENAFIKDLLDFNEAKFGEVIDILKDEIDKGKEIQKEINTRGFEYFYESDNILLSGGIDSLEDEYNNRMQKYNDLSVDSIKNLLNSDAPEKSEIERLGDELLEKLDNSMNNNLTLSGNGDNLSQNMSSSAGSCKMQDSSFKYEGIYISEEDSNGVTKNYRLFDYTDELKGDEILQEYGEGHIALMIGKDIYIKENLSIQKDESNYYTGNPLVLSKSNNDFYNHDISFYEEDNLEERGFKFHEAINGFRETLTQGNFINLGFNQPTNPLLTNFRIEFFDIVDKFNDKFSGYIPGYLPVNTKKYIIDAFSGIVDSTRLPKDNETQRFFKSNNLVVLDNLTTDSLNGVHLRKKILQPVGYTLISNRDDLPLEVRKNSKLYSESNYTKIEYYEGDNYSNLKTKELSYKEYFSPSRDIQIQNIEGRLMRYVGLGRNGIVINPGRKLYTGKDSVSIIYYLKSEESIENKQKRITLGKHQNIEFEESAVIQFIDGGDLSISSTNFVNLYGSEIRVVRDSPLLPGSTIDIQTDNGGIDLKYYDGTSYSIDFSKIKYYEVYNLGSKKESNQPYNLRTNIENDFYYSRVKSFRKGIWGSYSNQILLSPQLEADKSAPEISAINNFRVPINLKRRINATNYISENLGLANIRDIWIDFDLEKDSSGDQILDNDRDYELGINDTKFDIKINTEIGAIYFDIGPFDTTFKKDIKLYVEDNNGNIGSRVLEFEVYAPDLEIFEYLEEKNNNGELKGILKGTIDGNDYFGSLVDIYRIRGGNKRLSPLESLRARDNGLFQLNDLDITKGLNVTNNEGESTTFFGLNEETGKINSLNPAFSINVFPSNHVRNKFAYPKITINRGDEEIYYQYLVVPNVGKVNIVDDFVNNMDVGVYYKHGIDIYDFNINPIGTKSNPGDLLVYRNEDGNILSKIKIFKDGRIELPPDYKLEYMNENGVDYIIYGIKNYNGNIIGRVMIVPDKHYIME